MAKHPPSTSTGCRYSVALFPHPVIRRLEPFRRLARDSTEDAGVFRRSQNWASSQVERSSKRLHGIKQSKTKLLLQT